MSDNEYERFEITDYDLQNEFNPNRPKKRVTKHQQIYGIWADDSENEDDNDKGRKRGRQAKNYSAPVSFVAGGIQQSKKNKKSKEKCKDDLEITDEDEDNPSFSKNDHSNTSTESESEEERNYSSAKSNFQRSTFQPQGTTKGLASWEQHTKGIGAKLLLQMGYKPGKGLGKDLQGISQPVEAHVRKGRGAIGAYGPEKRSTHDSKKTQSVENDMAEAKESREKQSTWKKDENYEKSKKNRYYYRSVEEVIEKSKLSSNVFDKLSNSKMSSVKVIDMTGPEKRVLSGYHALSQSKIIDDDTFDNRSSKICSNFSLPELKHNLNLIIELSEQQIIANDKKSHEAKDKQKQLEIDKEKLQNIVKLEINHINTIEEALELVNRLIHPAEPLTLIEAEKIFSTLQTNFAAEYKEFGLGDLAAGIIAPLVNTELSSWKPLEAPTFNVDKIKKWRTILGMHQSETRNVFDPYSSLIWIGVIPSFRAAITDWNPKQYQPMAALLDAWAPLFPTWILDNVLEQLILPQLLNGVINWDPLTDTVPIHVWVLPWSGILGHKMEDTVYSSIREKLGKALQAWMPHDRSARAMLTPWKTAFASGELDSFYLKHIMPKLQITLEQVIINPLQQDLELWNQVWEWHEIVSPLLMAQLLDKHFFPKWMQTLVIWLNQNPNLDQISRWYTGWKNLLSEPVLQQTNIKEHFNRALKLMHRATSTPTPNIPEPVPARTSQDNQMPPALMDLQIPAPVQLEFKELVSQKCAERGILYVPIPGRREFGKQVYRIGKLFCYIDRQVLMLSDGVSNNWTPTSLGLMLERAAM